MSAPEKLRPGKTRQDLTEDAAGEFAVLAQSLRTRGYDPADVAHFINRLVFCMFAQVSNLLPAKMFTRMDRLRRNWLNPSNLMKQLHEVTEGFPDRVVPRDDAAASLLKKRTLTDLYNERPVWLANAHAELDRAVAVAYGWPTDIATDETLRRLLELNLVRSSTAAG